MLACRKCGSQNPPSNDYCHTCGGVLKITTMEIQAQPQRVIPIVQKFSIRWILFGFPVMLGSATVFLLLGGMLFSHVFNQTAGKGELDELASAGPTFIGVLALMGAFTFTAGGFLLARISKARRTLEACISGLLVVLFGGFVGQSISNDAIIASLIFAVPASLLAGVGGRFGKPNSPRKDSR